jgi:hypothetical protein
MNFWMVNLTNRRHAGSVMIPTRGMKKCPNARMLFISSVRVATRIMKPVL